MHRSAREKSRQLAAADVGFARALCSAEIPTSAGQAACPAKSKRVASIACTNVSPSRWMRDRSLGLKQEVARIAFLNDLDCAGDSAQYDAFAVSDANDGTLFQVHCLAHDVLALALRFRWGRGNSPVPRPAFFPVKCAKPHPQNALASTHVFTVRFVRRRHPAQRDQLSRRASGCAKMLCSQRTRIECKRYVGQTLPALAKPARSEQQIG